MSQRVFHEFGLSNAIRPDNDVPFASAQALFGLSKLAVWWLRLGIAIERIKAGHSQQNGRHERMHLTLKQESTKPVAQDLLQHRSASTTSSTATTTNVRTGRSTCVIRPSSTPSRGARTAAASAP